MVCFFFLRGGMIEFNNMKIGFFTDTYLPVGYGIQISVETFRKTLEKMGHEVYVFTPYVPGYKDVIKNVFRFNSVRIIKNPEMRLALPIAHNGELRKAVNFDLDVVHCHTPFTMGFLGKYVSKHQSIPMVYTHHTAYPDYAKVYLKEKYIIPEMAKWVSKLFGNWADGVIAPSVKIERTLREYGVKKPIYILPTGVDLDYFKIDARSRAAAKALRESWGVKAGDKVLLSLCRIDKAKNLGFIAESFPYVIKKYPNTKLVFVGDGQYMKELKALVKRLGIATNVIFPGFIDDAHKSAYYQAADAFLFASNTETQGIVILEAMVSGLPIIALQDDSFKGQVKNGRNGYLLDSRTSPEGFGKKIIKFLGDDSEKLREFGKNSVEMAKDYSEKHQAEKLLAIYTGLIAAHKKKS